jgi:hypothetical protein
MTWRRRCRRQGSCSPSTSTTSGPVKNQTARKRDQQQHQIYFSGSLECRRSLIRVALKASVCKKSFKMFSQQDEIFVLGLKAFILINTYIRTKAFTCMQDINYYIFCFHSV